MLTYLKGLFHGYKTFRYDSSSSYGTYGFGQWLANKIQLHANNLELDVQYHKGQRIYWVVVRGSDEYLCSVKLVEVSEIYEVEINYNPKVSEKTQKILGRAIMDAMSEYNAYVLKNDSSHWIKINNSFK